MLLDLLGPAQDGRRARFAVGLDCPQGQFKVGLTSVAAMPGLGLLLSAGRCRAVVSGHAGGGT